MKRSRDDAWRLTEIGRLLRTGPVQTLDAHKRPARTVGWNSTGQLLATGSVDSTIRIWNVDKNGAGKEISVLQGHTDSADQICWDPTQPDVLASVGSDKLVLFWDARSKASVHKIQLKSNPLNIAWRPDGRYVIVSNKDDVVSVIDGRTRKVLKEHSFTNEINEMKWNNSGTHIFLTSGADSGRAGLVEVAEMKPSGDLKTVHRIAAHTASCYSLDFDPLSRYFAAGSADALVSLWDLDELACVRTFDACSTPVRTVSFSHDGVLLATGSEDLEIDVSHVQSGRSVAKIPVKAAMNQLEWHPSKLLLAYAADERERDEGVVRIVGIPNSAVLDRGPPPAGATATPLPAQVSSSTSSSKLRDARDLGGTDLRRGPPSGMHHGPGGGYQRSDRGDYGRGGIPMSDRRRSL